MYNPNEDQMDEFANFVVKSLQQQRFFFLGSSLTNSEISYLDNRNTKISDRYLAYFVNMENAACITKYFLRFF